ncbi:hypothetical protein Scep_011725 [Stephania cephalantha]|uniref:GED domain-containing protein n=1 Tax=Stephania cephalantha TaxID=152367 RepID=A0AAP0JFW4_9MAGN
MRITAYWKIVILRLVDSLALYLQTSLSNLLCKEMEEVIVKEFVGSGNGSLERLLFESPDVARKRAKLNDSVNLLKESTEYLHYQIIQIQVSVKFQKVQMLEAHIGLMFKHLLMMDVLLLVDYSKMRNWMRLERVKMMKLEESFTCNGLSFAPPFCVCVCHWFPPLLPALVLHVLPFCHSLLARDPVNSLSSFSTCGRQPSVSRKSQAVRSLSLASFSHFGIGEMMMVTSSSTKARNRYLVASFKPSLRDFTTRPARRSRGGPARIVDRASSEAEQRGSSSGWTPSGARTAACRQAMRRLRTAVPAPRGGGSWGRQRAAERRTPTARRRKGRR